MRELRPQVLTLLDSGHTSAHSTVDIDLPSAGGADLHWSSGQLFLDNFGETRQYTSVLGDDVGDLEMTLGAEAQTMDIKADNTNPELGQVFTGADTPLQGNSGVVGTLFLNPNVPIESGEHFYDPRMRVETVLGSINEFTVDLSLFSVLDATTVGGVLISKEFPWREPASAMPTTNPNDIPPGRGPGTGNGPGGGRYPDPDDHIGDLSPRTPRMDPGGPLGL